MSQDNRLLPSLPVERGLDRPLSDLSQPKSYGSSLTEPAHLREYLNVVLKRKWLILSLVLVVTSLVTIHMYRTPSIFEAATTIQIEPKTQSVLSRKDAVIINTGRTTDPAYINTQLRLLENPTLARQVIRTLDLQNNPTFFGGQAQAGFLSSLKRIFAGEKKSAPPSETAPGTLPVVRVDDVTDNKMSPEELDKLEPYELTLAANLTVEPIVGTNLVTLRYRHTNPELARQVVNTLADTFIYNNYDRENSSTTANLEQLGKRIADLQKLIHDEEEQRVNFLTQNRLPVGEGDNLPVKRQAMLSEQLLAAENERKDKEAIYRAAAASPDPWSIPEVQESKRVQELRKQVDDLKLKRAEMLQTYTEAWPPVKKLDAQIRPLEEALQKAPVEVVSAMKTRYESAKAHEDNLRRAYNAQSGETNEQNRAQIQLTVFKQELETNKQEYDTLKQRQRELENNASGTRQNNVTVTNYARLPREPVGPARGRTIILALLLSLGVGVGLAFLLDYLDDTLKSVDDVDRYLHLPSLALIPASRSERARLIGARRAPVPSTEGDPMTALALTSDVRSPSAEAYRHLRTSLLLSSAGQPPKTILVTSSQPSEGKTTTAINTAIMLAQTGADVLIVDCDLRRPRVHANFGVSNARGLTNYLSGERDLDTLVQTYGKLANLKVLTSGPIPPNPAELLGSTEMRRLLTALSERFTHIVIDSPPAISFTDASILSTLVDGVMLVVHGGRSSRGVVRRAKQQLVDVGANIFGVVLNNVRLDAPDYYYSGYYSNYYANPEDEEADEEAEAGVAGRAG
jgi:succinoglycan biosynthesis transport protein ExoP